MNNTVNPYHRRDIRLLLVEDSEPDAFLLIRELRNGGFNIDFQRIETPEAMKAALDEAEWDLIVADYVLPGFSGLEALDVLKESRRDIPFIIVSGRIGEDIAVEAMRAGARDFIMKANLRRLVPAVCRELREADIRRERREAKADLAAERQRFYDLLETLPLYVVLFGKDHRVPFANRYFRDRFGCADRRQCYEWLYSRDEPCENCQPLRVLKTMAPHRWEWNAPDGRIYDIFDFPFTEATGETLVLEIGIDITEQKHAREMLRKTNEMLEQRVTERTAELAASREDLNRAQAVSHTGSWRLDLRRNVLSWSEETYRIFGIPFGTPLTYDMFLSAVHPEDREYVDQVSNAAAATKTPCEIDYRILASGAEKWVRTKAELEFGPDGSVAGAFGSVQDITDRKEAEAEKDRLEAQLAQAQKMEAIGRMAGGIAHDFNNLLSVILGYGEIALARSAGRDPVREPLREINKAAMKARGLTAQLLALSRKQVLEVRPVDINDLVTGFGKMIRRVIGEDIDIQIRLSPSPVSVMADRNQIEQVLMNLAVNARDAMPDGGRLTIETSRGDLDERDASRNPDTLPGTYARITVSDTGIGIPPENIDQVFEPFFTTKEKDRGTGLGLATTYGIVKQHGGNIRVGSTPGRWTTFDIYLPLSTVREKKGTETVSETRATKSDADTVLLVEDDPSVRKLTHTLLETEGYRVISADTPAEAIELAKNYSGPIHLLLTDVLMPGMKGPELYRRVSEHYPGINVVYMSGYTRNLIAREGALEKGAFFIQKPFTVNELAAKIGNALHKAD